MGFYKKIETTDIFPYLIKIGEDIRPKIAVLQLSRRI